MNKNWRIKKRSVKGYSTTYTLQKRLLGFLWWFNPDWWGYGVYSTLESAQEVYRRKTAPISENIIEVSDD